MFTFATWVEPPRFRQTAVEGEKNNENVCVRPAKRTCSDVFQMFSGSLSVHRFPLLISCFALPTGTPQVGPDRRSASPRRGTHGPRGEDEDRGGVGDLQEDRRLHVLVHLLKNETTSPCRLWRRSVYKDLLKKGSHSKRYIENATTPPKNQHVLKNPQYVWTFLGGSRCCKNWDGHKL